MEKSRLYTQSKKAYNNLIETFESFFSLLEKNLPDFNAADNLKMFDVMLQYSLIEAVIIDLRFTNEQAEYVRLFSKYDNIVSYLSRHGYKSYTWDNIGDPDVSGLVSDLDSIHDDIADEGGSFVATICIIMTLEGENAQELFDLITYQIVTIFIGIINFDEDTNEYLQREVLSSPIFFALKYIAEKENLKLNIDFE